MSDHPIVSPHLELQYDRTPGGAIGRRAYALLIVLTLLNSALFAGYLIGPKAWRAARERWQAQEQAAAQRRQDQLTAAARKQMLIQAVADQEQMLAARQALADAELQRKRDVKRRREALLAACRTHTFAPDTVVLEQDPSRAARLMSRPGAAERYALLNRAFELIHPPARIRSAPPWLALLPELDPPAPAGGEAVNEKNNLAAAGPPIFLHDRTAKGAAAPRLVAVLLTVEPTWDIENGPTAGLATRFRTVSIDPAVPLEGRIVWHHSEVMIDAGGEARLDFSAGERPGEAGIRCHNMLRMYAGRADPSDASHFTIPYAIDGRASTIDGWLKPDGSVEFKPRGGRVVERHGGVRVWEIGGQ